METYEFYNPVDEEIIEFLEKHPKFSKMSSLKLCSTSGSDTEHDETSFEDNAAYEIFSKVCDVDSNVKDPDYVHFFKKIDVKDKLLMTYNDYYCGAISGNVDGKEFILAFELYYDPKERPDFKPFANFDREINKVKEYDDEAMWMAMCALYM